MKNEIIVFGDEEQKYIINQISQVREDKQDCEYLIEARRVLPVKGYRSAIGCYWNSVIDDLRRKVMHRSLDVFNKEYQAIGGKKDIKEYEDFQNHVTDYDLIECAYRMGAISWEARKILHQARETRNVFDGHPKSSSPELVKVLSFISDCNKYVLNVEFPIAIINISDYLKTMDSTDYDRNDIAVRQAMSDLPETYKKELIHRLYSMYKSPSTSTTIKSNIEFLAPILWPELSKEIKLEVGRGFDKDISKGIASVTQSGLEFMKLVNGLMYVSTATREAIFRPVIDKLNHSLDKWDEEEKTVKELEKLGYNIPASCINEYVNGITCTFVGYTGGSYRSSRTDFYSNAAASHITPMFKHFDNKCVTSFVNVIKTNKKLQSRIGTQAKLNRLRELGNIILEKGVGDKSDREFIEMMCDDSRKTKFYIKIDA